MELNLIRTLSNLFLRTKTNRLCCTTVKANANQFWHELLNFHDKMFKKAQVCTQKNNHKSVEALQKAMCEIRQRLNPTSGFFHSLFELLTCEIASSHFVSYRDYAFIRNTFSFKPSNCSHSCTKLFLQKKSFWNFRWIRQNLSFLFSSSIISICGFILTNEEIH